jgi:hypothetical protein
MLLSWSLNRDRGFYKALDLDLYSISSVALYCVGRSLATDWSFFQGLLRGLYDLHFISDAQLKATPCFLKINLKIMKTLASLFATWILSFTFLNQIRIRFSSIYSVRATWPSSLPRLILFINDTWWSVQFMKLLYSIFSVHFFKYHVLSFLWSFSTTSR